MIVKGAAHADVAEAAEVAARSYRQAFRSILSEEILAARDAAFFADRFEASLDRLRVAHRNGRVVGFCLVTDGHIDMLFVDPESIGTGAGRALLRDAERGGATSLECFRDNHPARRFYEKQGWTIEREYERDFLGERRMFVLFVKPGPATAAHP